MKNVRKENIEVQVFSMDHPGNKWPWHNHVWVPLSEHPRGGEVAFCFMLEAEEREKVEMCLNCLARRIKK